MSWIKPDVAIETLEREGAVFDQIAMHARTIFTLSLTLAALATAILTFLAGNGRDLQAFLSTGVFTWAFTAWLLTISFAAVLAATAQWDLLLSRQGANRIARTQEVPDAYGQLKNSKITEVLYALVPLFYLSILYSFLAFTGGVVGFFTAIGSAEALSGLLVVYSAVFVLLTLIFWIEDRFLSYLASDQT
jgi:hypothetical protein